jgi:hypothetical protein
VAQPCERQRRGAESALILFRGKKCRN